METWWPSSTIILYPWGSSIVYSLVSWVNCSIFSILQSIYWVTAVLGCTKLLCSSRNSPKRVHFTDVSILLKSISILPIPEADLILYSVPSEWEGAANNMRTCHKFWRVKAPTHFKSFNMSGAFNYPRSRFFCCNTVMIIRQNRMTYIQVWPGSWWCG